MPLEFRRQTGAQLSLGERTVRIPMDAHRLTMAGPHFWGEIPLRFTKIENFENPLFVPKNDQKEAKWARSSAGRAFGSHPRGRRFDPVRVHHLEKNHRQFGGDFSFDHNFTTDGTNFCPLYGNTGGEFLNLTAR